MFTKVFALAAGERAVKSFAQALLLLWVSDQGFDVLNIDVAHSFGFAAGAAVLSILTSIVSSGVGGEGPSLTTETLDTETGL